MGPGKPGKSWKFKISKSRPGKPGKYVLVLESPGKSPVCHYTISNNVIGGKETDQVKCCATTSFSCILCHRKFRMIGVNSIFCTNDAMCHSL